MVCSKSQRHSVFQEASAWTIQCIEAKSIYCFLEKSVKSPLQAPTCVDWLGTRDGPCRGQCPVDLLRFRISVDSNLYCTCPYLHLGVHFQDRGFCFIERYKYHRIIVTMVLKDRFGANNLEKLCKAAKHAPIGIINSDQEALIRGYYRFPVSSCTTSRSLSLRDTQGSVQRIDFPKTQPLR